MVSEFLCHNESVNMHSSSSPLSTTVSKVLDFAVVPGFSKIGFLIRKKLGGWSEISDFDLTGKTVVITGPTSGLGKAAAHQLAAMGADLILVGRSAEKLERTKSELVQAVETQKFHTVVADMGAGIALARRTLASGARPCSQNSSWPPGTSTRRISRRASTASGMLHKV